MTLRVAADARSKEWVESLDSVLMHLEEAEMGLASDGPGRKLSGSYYTPSDVAAHFWRLFWRHHEISDRASAIKFVHKTNFVEPSVGSGMFLFSLLRSLVGFGINPAELAAIKFQAVDINQAALDFVKGQLLRLEDAFSLRFGQVSFEHANFLTWIKGRSQDETTFIGNPPFVANPRGSRWKNMYANFVESMLSPMDSNNLGLILPMSICFSRDYVELRRLLAATGGALSASSYDNIPDSLFKAGKPESENTNKANSQRCTILNLGGTRKGVVESTALLRWTAGERESFLAKTPRFHDCSEYDIKRQIPRPSDSQLTKYLRETEGDQTVLDFLSDSGGGAFAVVGVARNFIGIRDYEGKTPGVIPIRTVKRDSALILLQVFTSGLFYEYWRSFGDGFHVTNNLIGRFPISEGLLYTCEANLDVAATMWKKREKFAKTKLNSGRTVKSYDFSTAFAHVASNHLLPGSKGRTKDCQRTYSPITP